MVVLDEQLQGRGIENAIAQWYPGAVCFVFALRPGTIIKDESIPALLNQQAEPTFVTINEADFWQRIPLTPRFCLICLSLPDNRAGEVPALVRRVLKHSRFDTKAKRTGCAVRVTANEAKYYTVADATVHSLDNW